MRPRRKFNEDTSGSSAVEFALLLPILVTIIFGIIEFGLIIYTLNTAQSAARDATRQLATNRITASQASGVVLQQLPRWVTAGTSVSVSQTAPSNPSNNLFTTDVSFAAKAATPTSLLSWAYGSTILHAKVSMQQEPGT
ncbi:TadE/TadG family type IV pilus assembly protein [Methylobacterium sp. CM6257]|jgi:Flp pilus assembly protein TadG